MKLLFVFVDAVGGLVFVEDLVEARRFHVGAMSNHVFALIQAENLFALPEMVVEVQLID